MGILGEDRITCIDGELLGFSLCEISKFGTFGKLLTIAVCSTGVILTIELCLQLLNSEATQLMAASMFQGTDSHSGAVIGLVLCAFFPVALLAWRMYLKVTIMRLIKQCPPATD